VLISAHLETEFLGTEIARLTSTKFGFCSQTNCADGSQPIGKLIQSAEGNFYGTTSFGGSSTFGNETTSKITPSDILKTLYVFCRAGGNSCLDGANPNAALVQATDGNFYDITSGGGYSLGQANCRSERVLVRDDPYVTPAGKLTTLYDFCTETNCADSGTPISPLIKQLAEPSMVPPLQSSLGQSELYSAFRPGWDHSSNHARHTAMSGRL
jgi:hypothetical protein